MLPCRTVCTIEVLDDRALLALQGPEAESVLARLAPDSASMRFMDARIARDRRQRLPRDPIRLHRRGWLRDQRCRLRKRRGSRACFWTMRPLRWPVWAPATACGSRPAFASTARISTRTRRRSKRRWNGRSRKFAAGRRARRRISRRGRRTAHSSMTVRRGAASACGRKIECRCAAALCCLPGVPRPSPSARSRPAASDLRSAVRSPWVTCRARCRRPARRVFAEVRGSRVPVEVTDLPFVPHRYKRTNRGVIPSC